MEGTFSPVVQRRQWLCHLQRQIPGMYEHPLAYTGLVTKIPEVADEPGMGMKTGNYFALTFYLYIYLFWRFGVYKECSLDK